MAVQFRDLKERNKVIIMAALLLCTMFVTWYYHAKLRTNIIFTHLFYIPVVLASMWWKLRGIAVAVFLGLILSASHLLFTPDLPLIPDLCRAAMFVVIAFVVAVLSEQIASAVLLYKTLAGGSYTGVYILQDRKLKYINRRALEYAGYSEEEILQMPLLDLIHPDDRVAVKEQAVGMLKGVRTAPYEFRVIDRDGRVKWILETVTPIRFEGRKAVLGNAMDITERKLAEEELRESEEKYRTILENIEDGYHEVNLAGSFTFFNDSFLKITGYSREELMGMNYKAYAADEKNARKVFEAYNEVYRTGEPVQRFEWDIIRKDGARRSVEVSASLIRGSAGSPLGFRGIVRDTTDRKIAEDIVSQQLRFLQVLMDAIPDPLFYKDGAGRYQGCNKAFEEYLGLQKQEIVGKTVYEVSPGEVAQKYSEMDLDLFERPGKQVYEMRVPYADGTHRDVILSKATYHRRDGSVAGLIGVMVDITERKRAEDALRESEGRYRNLYEEAPSAMFSVGFDDGLIHRCNRRAGLLLGCEADALIGKPVIELYEDTPNGKQKARQVFWRFRAGEQIIDEELKMRRADGTNVWVSLSVSPVRDAGGRILESRSMVVDITERKEKTAEIEIKSLLLDSASDSIFMMDLEGHFHYMNENAYKSRGYSRDELMAMNLRELDDPAYREAIPLRFKEVMEKGSAVFESAHRCKDGSVMPVEVHSRLMDIEGQKFLFSVIRDITERKQAEEALQSAYAERQELEFIVSHSPAVVWLWKAAEGWPVEYVSNNVVMYGYVPEDFTSGRVAYAAIVHPEDLPRVAAEVERYTKEGRTGFTQVYRIFAKSGDMHWIDDRTWVRRGPDGSITHYQGISVDVTERKQAEEALRESERRYNELAHSLPQIIFEADLKGNLTFVNHTAYSMSGYSPEDLEKGLNVFQMLVPEDRERAGLNMKRIMQGDGLRGNEYTFLGKDGRTFPIITESSPIVRDNRIVGLRGILIDITERKQLEARLAEARRMEAIGRLASGASHEIRNPLNIMSVRLQMMELTGKSRDQDVLHVIKTCHEQIGRITRILEGLDDFSRIPETRKARSNLRKIVEEAAALHRERMTKEDVAVKIDFGGDIPSLMLDKDKIALVISHLISNAADAMKDRETKKLDISIRQTPGGRSVCIVVSDTGHGIRDADLARIFDPFFTTKDPDKGKGLGLSVAYGIVRDHGGTIRAENNKEGGASVFVDLPLEGSAKIS